MNLHHVIGLIRFLLVITIIINTISNIGIVSANGSLESMTTAYSLSICGCKNLVFLAG